MFEPLLEILGTFFNQYNYYILPEQSMYNSVPFGHPQNPIIFYTCCSYIAYSTPYVCTPTPLQNCFYQNFRNSQEKHENPTSNNTETAPLGAQQRHQNTTSSRGPKTNKRRHYRNKSKLIESAKKNCESNIINHILAFLTKNKESQAILEKAIRRLEKPLTLQQQIKQIFYDILKLINLKRERKYINRKTILCFFSPERLKAELPFLQEKMQECGLVGRVSLEELCYLYRVCIYYYIRNQGQVAILTSKRIEAIAKKIHLKRRSFIREEIEA